MKLGEWKIVAEAEGKELEDMEADDFDALVTAIDGEIGAAIEHVREWVAYQLQELLPNKEVAAVSVYIEDWSQ